MYETRQETRRLFLRAAAAFSCTLAFPQEQVPTPVSPRHGPWPAKPTPGTMDSAGIPPSAAHTSAREALVQHEQELRQTLEDLFTKVQELRTELASLHTADVFSVTVYKQTQQIEKLAKALRNHAKIS
jgi:hypothetical protein